MLTPIQREVAHLIADLAEAEGFALAGGAAMILRGQIDRQTQDLDFFGLVGSDVYRLLPAAETALRAAGFQVERRLEGPSFVRLEIHRAGQVTELDLAADARLLPVEQDMEVPTLNPQELAVDKLLAIFGRAEARDFADFAAVVDQYGLEALARLALEKDPGFSLEVLAEMMDRFGRLRADEFNLDQAGYQQLAAKVAAWRSRSIDLARFLGPQLGRDRGPEI